MIACRSCGEEKPPDQFSRRRDSGKLRPACKACRSGHNAARRYGITVGEVECLKRKQNDCCAICGTPSSAIAHASFHHNPLVIDHDHETGRIRGLLCPSCNTGIGQFKDSPVLLEAAARYLRACEVAPS